MKYKVAIINDTRPEKHYGCMTVMNNLISVLERDVDILWTWPVNKDWRDNLQELQELPLVDAVIVNGEGTIHHSATRPLARSLAEFAKFAKEQWAVPCYLINATLADNEADVYQLLSSYKKIFVRDKASLKELEMKGLEAAYVPDLTFATVSEGEVAPSKGLGMCSSVLRTTRKDMRRFARKHNMREVAIIDYKPELSLLFNKPHKYFQNLVKWVRLGNKKGLPSEFVLLLREHEFVLTGRYHAVTFCLKYQVPFLAITSNTPKIESLLNDVFESDRRVTSIKALNELSIETFFVFGEEERVKMRSFTLDAERAIQDMLSEIVSDIKV